MTVARTRDQPTHADKNAKFMPKAAQIDNAQPASKVRRFQPDEYRALAELVERRTGLVLGQQRQREIESRLSKSVPDGEAGSLVHAAYNSQEALQQVVNRLTIGESSFFRNQPHFEALEKYVLPDIIQRRDADRTIKIWCAGCSRGQEPYSIDIFLREKFPEIRRWKRVIVASDINTEYLTHAAKGIYHQWDLRGVDERLRERYFTRQSDGSFRLAQEVVRAVTFKQYNMVDFPYHTIGEPETFDLVLCRNVLIYFGPRTSARIVSEIGTMLRPGGYFFVGHSETYSETESLRICLTNETYYYRRDTDNKSRPSQRARRRSLLLIPGVGNRSQIPPPLSRPTAKPPKLSIHPFPSHTKPPRRRSSPPIAIEPINEVTRALEKAAKCANQGKLEIAAGLLDSLSTGIGKVDHRVYFMVGIVANQRNLIQKAIESFKRAIFLDKAFALGHFYLAILYEREGKARIANKHFRNVAKLLEKIPDDLVLEGSQDLSVGRLKQIVQIRLKEVEGSDNQQKYSRG